MSHDARRFMSQRERLPNEDVAIPKVGVVVEIASAKPSGGDLYLKLIWSRRRKISMFLTRLSDLQLCTGARSLTILRSLMPWRTDASTVVNMIVGSSDVDAHQGKLHCQRIVFIFKGSYGMLVELIIVEIRRVSMPT